MKFEFDNEEALIAYVQERVVLSEEATGIVGVSRQRLYELRKAGRIVPLVEGNKGVIYWRPDLEQLRAVLSTASAMRHGGRHIDVWEGENVE